MIVIQINRIFVVPEVAELIKNKIIPIEHKKEPKNEQRTYKKKTVKYFIPAFYI
jgi:hypothetical protein